MNDDVAGSICLSGDVIQDLTQGAGVGSGDGDVAGIICVALGEGARR